MCGLAAAAAKCVDNPLDLCCCARGCFVLFPGSTVLWHVSASLLQPLYPIGSMATSPAAGRSSRPLANSSILWPTSCSHAPSLPTAAAETGSRTAALLAIPAVLIILREMFASALRGWTASVGESSLTTVGIWGKLKPAFTLFSLTGLLATCRTHSDGVFRVSLYLLYSTRHGARLSVGSYVKAALPAFIARSQHPKGEKSVELLPLTFRSGLGFSEEDAKLEKLRCRNGSCGHTRPARSSRQGSTPSCVLHHICDCRSSSTPSVSLPARFSILWQSATQHAHNLKQHERETKDLCKRFTVFGLALQFGLRAFLEIGVSGLRF